MFCMVIASALGNQIFYGFIIARMCSDEKQLFLSETWSTTTAGCGRRLQNCCAHNHRLYYLF